jgi:hypothetical protein
MRNLEIYGVQELNAREIRETDGGRILSTIFVNVSYCLKTLEALAGMGDGLRDNLN